LINKSLLVGIVFLFIFSTVTPLVIGYDVEIANRELMDDLAFDCYNRYNSSRVSYYREYLPGCSSDEDFESDRIDSLEESEVKKATENVEIELDIKSVDGPIDSPWPMKCQNNRHTSLSPYSTADNYGAEKWRFETDGWIEGGPVIDKEGNIYFGCFDYCFYSLHPNGTMKWKFKTNGWLWSTPAIAEDGTIYIGSYNHNMYAINPNGTLKWTFGSSGSISSSPAIAEDGTIYFGTMKGFDKGDIIAVNPNGTRKWRYETGYYITSDPTIGDDGTVYIGSGDKYLYAINPDGTLQWRFKTGDWVKAHPSIAEDGTIYISSFDHYLYALYPNGTMIWKYSGGGDEASVAIDEDGTIYLGNAQLHAIYLNGTRKWMIDVGPNIDHASPAISADGAIYVGAGKYIIAINLDGTERWRKRIANEWVESSPCIGEDGTVYIGVSNADSGDFYGYLYAFGRGEINQPPNPPSINGPMIGLKNKQHTYNFTLDDPELDDIELFVDWDDGNTTGWLGPFDSGETQTLIHSWSEKGTYTVKAKARDTYDGSESNWGTLKVSMPKNKIINPFERFLENHPHMFPLLRYLMGV
jgi:outer membrane protein assembly factor BamB